MKVNKQLEALNKFYTLFASCWLYCFRLGIFAYFPVILISLSICFCLFSYSEATIPLIMIALGAAKGLALLHNAALIYYWTL